MPGLIKLGLLRDEIASQLRAALGVAARKKHVGRVSAEDLDPIPGISEADLEQIVEAVVGLNQGRIFGDTDIEEFVKAVTESMQSAAPSDFPMAVDLSDRLGKRIREFLTIDELVRSAKTNVLKYEHERPVHSLRILTDVRPIFGNSAEEAPEAAVVVHTLKLAYLRGGRVDEVFFAMDEGDLLHLKRAVARAELKAKSIRTALMKAQLEVIAEE